MTARGLWFGFSQGGGGSARSIQAEAGSYLLTGQEAYPERGAHRYWQIRFSNDRTGSFSGNTRLVEMEMRGFPGEADLTGSGTASAWAGTAANAFDNDTGTVLIGANETANFVRYDFGAGNECTINQITLRADASFPGDLPSDFFLMWSDNGVNFYPDWGYINCTAYSASEVRTFTRPNNILPARTWGMFVLSIANTLTGQACMVQDLKFSNFSQNIAVDMTDLFSVTAYADANTIQPASNAFDGNLLSNWTSDLNNHNIPWICCDFGGNPQAISFIQLACGVTVDRTPTDWIAFYSSEAMGAARAAGYGITCAWRTQYTGWTAYGTYYNDNVSTGPMGNVRWRGNIGDPFYQYVTLLLHFDGADGATSDIDYGPQARPITFENSAALSDFTAPFGSGTSLDLTAGGDARVNCGDYFSYTFGAGQFTIEAEVYLDNFPDTTPMMIVSKWTPAPGREFQFWCQRSGSNVTFYFDVSTTGSDAFGQLTTWVGSPLTTSDFNTGAWYHVCVDFDGATYRFYLNGTLKMTGATVRTIYNSTTPLYIGNRETGSGYSWRGYIDEVRITKGLARYRGINFTPPSAPHKHYLADAHLTDRWAFAEAGAYSLTGADATLTIA